MEKERFNLTPGKWFALQMITVTGGSPSPQLAFTPFFVERVTPRKTGKNHLGIEGIHQKITLNRQEVTEAFIPALHETEAFRRDLIIIYRKETMIGESGQTLYLFSELNWDWLHDYCPQIFHRRGRHFIRNQPGDLQFFLDQVFKSSVKHAAYIGFKDNEIHFEYTHKWGKHRLRGTNLPLEVEGHSFLDAYKKAHQQLAFYFSGVDELHNIPVRVSTVFEEDEILCAFAQQFDGYKHEHVTGRKIEQMEIPQDTADQMQRFFMLQRYLYKWGGEYEPRDGETFQTFRKLFLLLSRQPIPVEYQKPEFCQAWVENFEPFLAQVEKVVEEQYSAIEGRK
jgi:hypothetical protein